MIKEIICLSCDWAGKEKEAIWHDLSGFDDDTLCSGQSDSGWFECPECKDICEPLEKAK
jgi:hypothetical protein